MTAPILDVCTTPLAGHTLIEASAGTGKTWTISGLYTRLLLDPALNLQVSEILVVTFTLAATAELRDRIRKRLSDVLDSFRSGVGVDEFCQRLLDGYAGERDWAIRKLTRSVSSFDDAAIFTIHGFCQRILGEAAFESGADFGLEMLPDQSELLAEVVEDYWRQNVYPASGAWLDYLQLQQASPEAWRKAVAPFIGNLQRRLEPLAPVADVAPQLAEFDRLLAELQSMWRERGGEVRAALLNDSALKKNIYKPDGRAAHLDWLEQLLTGGELPRLALKAGWHGDTAKQFVYFSASKLLTSVTKGGTAPSHPLFDAIDRLLQLADALAAAFAQRLQHMLAGLLQYIERELPLRKHERQQLSFDDLLNKVWLATRGEQGAHFTAFVRSRYRAALIDEFQDTDPVQCGIFEAVYAGTGLPLYFVGDPKQAIYSFRGADIHAYLAARRGVDRSATLDTNQRSVPQLIQAVNTVFGNGANPVAFVDAGIQFQPVHAPDRLRPRLRVDGDSAAPLRFVLLPPELKDGVEKTRSGGAANALAADGCANEIARLLTLAAQGRARIEQGDDARPLAGGDIAVLVPSGWLASEMQQQLQARGIASVRQVRESVFGTAEAAALLLVLQAIAAPTRQGLVRTALVSPLLGYDVNTLQQAMDEGEPWETLLDEFSRWHQLWRDAGFMRMLRDWLDRPGAGNLSVPQRLLALADGERRLTNLLHLAELLQQQSRLRVGIEPLLAWLTRMVADPDAAGEAALMRLESDAERVQIVTIHSSKGLEYPVVFCPWLFQGRLGGDGVAVSFHRDDSAWLDFGSANIGQHRRVAAREALAEKLRLLYVALTRAKHRCYVAWGNVEILKPLPESYPAERAIEPGFHSSPLSWLLHPCPNQAKLDDPLPAMRDHCATLDSAAINADLRRLQQQAADAIDILPLPLAWQAAPALAALPAELQATPFSRPPLQWGWRVASFSGLTRETLQPLPSEQMEAPDHDADAPPEPEAAAPSREPSLFNFPLGEVPAAVAGTTIHAVLENWNWDRPDDLPAVVERELANAGLQPRWQPVVEQFARHTVATRLDRQALTLARATARQRLAEMEFTFPLQGLSVAAVQKLLETPQFAIDPAFVAASKLLSFDSLQGYLRGFIDLVFEVDGRYYIVDYKTNRLGNHATDYAPPLLTHAVAHSHYYLQYLIYSVAVHLHLQTRLPGYAYASHFGGVYYLFLRGMADESGQTGVFFDRPPLALIEAFAAQILGGKS